MITTLAAAVHALGPISAALGPILAIIAILLGVGFSLATATTVDRAMSEYDGGAEFSYPLYTSTSIPKGAMVSVNSSGYAVNTTNTNGDTFVGVCMRAASSVDSTATGGLVPDVYVRVRRKGVFSMVASGMALTTVGTDMYAVDNQTVTTTAAGSYIYVGKFVMYTSATEALIDISYATCGLPAVDSELARETVSIPVEASTSIAANDLVYTNLAGFAVTGASFATVGLKLEGVALAAADNGSGGQGAISVSVARKDNAVTHLTGTGFAATSVGKLVWASGAQTVSLTPGNSLAGVVTRYISATSVYVSLVPAMNKVRTGYGEFKTAHFTRATLATTAGTDVAKFQLPRKTLVKALYLTLVTAPGGSDTCVATYSDGTTTETVTATGTSKVGGTFTASGVAIKAATDITVNFTITGSTAAGATLVVEYEEL